MTLLWRRSELVRRAHFERAAALTGRLAVFVHAGLTPATAWRELAYDYQDDAELGDISAEIARALESGVRHRPAVWEALSGRGEAWRSVAALIVVADESGAPMAQALWDFSDALRERAGIESDLAALLQVPRHTTLLLLALPPAGLLIAWFLGVNSLAFLTGSLLGWLALIAAAIAVTVAVRWMARLTAQALPPQGSLSPATDLLRVATSGGALPEKALSLVVQVLGDLGLEPEPSSALFELATVSRRAGIPIGTLAGASARWERQRLRADAAAASASLSVKVLIPLGLLVLPAFVLVGVVPVVFTLLRGALAPTAGVVW